MVLLFPGYSSPLGLSSLFFYSPLLLLVIVGSSSVRLFFFFEVFLRLFLIPRFLVVVYLPWEVKECLCVRGLSCRTQVEE